MKPEITIELLLEKFSDTSKYLFLTAYNIAKEAHQYQKRKNDEPYMSHVDAVILGTYLSAVEIYSSVEIDALISIAALHDVIEDHGEKYSRDYILKELLKSLPDDYPFFAHVNNIVVAVVTLTKLPKEYGEPYDEYVFRVKNNRRASFVKKEDLKHNMSDLPYGNLLQKYQLTLFFLNN